MTSMAMRVRSAIVNALGEGAVVGASAADARRNSHNLQRPGAYNDISARGSSECTGLTGSCSHVAIKDW